LERHQHTISWLHAMHTVADLQHLGDALVAELEGRRKGRRAGNDERIQVAGGHGQVADDRFPVSGQLRLVHIPPLQLPGTGVDKGSHEVTLAKAWSGGGFKPVTSRHESEGD
jgi:hypothetical protein